jgi:hypothetical protein
LASNRAKAKAASCRSSMLGVEAAVASRVEQVLVADKTIRDQEDQLRDCSIPQKRTCVKTCA